MSAKAKPSVPLAPSGTTSAPAPRPPGTPDVPALRAPLLPWSLALSGAVVSGLLYWNAFAGMDVWPLTFVAFVPLWIAWQGQTSKRAFWLGAVAGTTMNVLGFYWLLNMLRTFSGFPTFLCMFFVFVVCAYQGIRVGFMGWLYARATHRGWPAIPVLLAGCIMIVDFRELGIANTLTSS